MDINDTVPGQDEPINNSGLADCSTQFAPSSQTLDQTIDCSVPVAEGLGATGPADGDIPDFWKRLVEYHFAGKVFGLRDFGSQFRSSLLAQIAAVKMLMERQYALTVPDKSTIDIGQVNELIAMCDRSGSPESTAPYVRPLLISILREDIGRAYLRSLQAKGEFMGTTYADMTAPPPEIAETAEGSAGLLAEVAIVAATPTITA